MIIGLGLTRIPPLKLLSRNMLLTKSAYSKIRASGKRTAKFSQSSTPFKTSDPTSESRCHTRDDCASGEPCAENGEVLHAGQRLAFGLFAERQQQDSDHEGESGERHGRPEPATNRTNESRRLRLLQGFAAFSLASFSSNSTSRAAVISLKISRFTKSLGLAFAAAMRSRSDPDGWLRIPLQLETLVSR